MTDKKRTKLLPPTTGEFSDKVTKINQDLEREFTKGEDSKEVPRADKPGGLHGNPD